MGAFKIGFELSISGKQKFYESQLRDGKSYRVGRQGEWLCIPDPALSRYHFELRVARDSVRVVDLTSTNGLFLNTLKLKEAPLKVGDVLEFGICKITVKSLSMIKDEGLKDEATIVVKPGAEAAGKGALPSLTQKAQQENLIPGLSPLKTPKYFFRLALKKPNQLFREADYRQATRESFLLILIIALLHWIVGNGNHFGGQGMRIFSQSFIFAAGMLVLASVFSLMMSVFRNWMQIEADFRQFLALFSFAYVLFLPVFLICTLAHGLLLVGWIAFSLFALFAATESIPAPAMRVIPAFMTSWIVALIPALILISLVL